ncbi:MAG: hypothetical protein GXO87_03495, partial [Chlorobi bacterium]|nr:hypothetical protein [Chlorobiota bacterium]
LDNDGFHFPNISLPDLASLGGGGANDGDGLRFEFEGLGLKPLAFRMPAFDMDWFSPDGGNGDWDFGFDFEIDFPNLDGDASDGMRFPEITMLDAHFTGGLILGDIELTEFAPPGLRFGLGGDFGLNFYTQGISGGFFDDGGSQGVNFQIQGNLQLPTFMRCDDGNDLADLTSTTFTFNSRGLITGNVERFLPECPIDLGFGIFRVTSSSLDFSIQENAQSAIMNMTGELEIPAGDGLTVTALGSLTMDLITGEILDGEIRIDQEFVWSIPFDNPVLSFRIQSAVLNGEGFAINGQSQLLLDGGSQIPVRFEDFLFDLKNQRVKSGRLVIDESFAFKMKLETGGINWSAIPYDEPLTEADGNAAKIGMASTMILDANGLSIDGEAIAAIRWLEDNYNALRIEYNGGFALGINPFSVLTGQADIFLEEEGGEDTRLAFLDSDGFHLEDMFELLELPEKIPLPELDIAYLQIKSGGNLLINSETIEGNLHIFTRNGHPVNFVIPSLQYSNGTPPAFDVEFDVYLNPTTFEFVSGEITLLPREGESSIINLKDFDVPVELTRISYAPVPGGGGYRLTANGRLFLPGVLDDMPLSLEDLEFDGDGLSGRFTMGQFSRTYVNVTTLSTTLLGETSAITLEGLLGDFDGSHFGFSGKFIPKIFNADGDTSDVHYAAEWNGDSNSFEFSFAFQNGEKWDLGIAEFEPKEIDGNPPISLTVSEEDFQFVLNGILTSDLFGGEFELPFENLTISKDNVAAEPVQRDRANAFDFELFKSRFKIYNAGGDNALGIEYEQNVLRLILSGDVEFFGLDAVIFNRFVIGTDGEFSIDGIDFLSQDEDNLAIVDDMIVLKRIYLDDNKLNFNGWVKLPEPANQNENIFNFAIFPDGSIEGSAEIVFLDQPRELGNGDESEYEFWEAVLDPTYLSLNLDFSDFGASSVRMVGDIYFNNDSDKRVEIGDNSGNAVVPGFELFFNGDYQWKNIRSVGEFPIIDWETFKVNLTNLSIPDGSNIFLLTLSGNFELNLEAAGGGLTFEDFRILSDGTVDRFAESINGGEFYILDVVTISVNDIGYSATPTTIEIDSGTMPSGGSGASSGDSSYDVESYLQFGGLIDISGIVSGGVEKFLTFKFNNRNQFIVKHAELSLPGMELIADFQYLKENDNSYNFLFGGSGDFAGQQIVVVGQVGKLRGNSSFGMFVAVPTVIPIGPIVITGLGGGFFYNPKREYINTVKTLAGLEARYTSRITNPGSSFAVFLYGKFVLVEEHIISARVLLTLTDSRFELDGKATLLNQPDTFAAYLHLGIGFTDFFAEGNLVVVIDADPLLVGGTTGEGLGFYVYGSDTWGIYGTVDANILKILHVGSEFYLGSEGFLLSMETDFSFDIWIIEIGAGMEVKLWYIPNESWGAYTKVYVYAEVLFGVAKAKGWLLGALVGDPNFYIYAAAGLEISVIGVSWDGEVWAKISGNGVDGGFGRNSEFDKLIDDAAETSGQIDNAKNNMLDKIADGQMIPVRITDEEMEAAFQTLYNWGRVFRYGTEADRQRANAFFNTIKSIELIPGYDPIDTQYDQEIMTYDWVINEVYKATHAPAISRRDDLHDYRANADQRRTDFNNFRDELRPKLSESLEEIRAFIDQNLQTGRNPLLQTTFSPPVANERIENGKTVKVVLSKPGFEIDLSVDDMNKDAMAATEEAFNEYKTETGQALQRINNNIVKLEALLGGSENNAGVRSVGEKYKTTLGYSELFFKQRQRYYSDEYTWANNLSIDWILGAHMKAPGFQSKSWTIFDNLGWEVNRDLCINRKIKILEISNAAQGRIDDARVRETRRWNLEAGNYNNPGNSNYFKNWVASEGITTGLALWSNLPIEYGLMEITSNARNVLAQNEVEMLNEKESMYHRQAIFTQTSDSLYDALSILYENQYDLITEYISVLQRRDNLSQGELFLKGLLILWKGQIEDKFRLPTISELKVTNSDYGTKGYNKSYFQWQISGAQAKSFAFDLRTQNPNFDRQGYQNIGMNRTIIKYFLKSPSANEEFGNVTFYLRARNRAGYTIKRSMTYQPAFKGSGDPRNISDPADNSMPSIFPILTFPNLFVKSFGAYYTTNTNSLAAEWEGHDNQSGIQEYKYAIGTSPDDKTSVLDWTSNGGRDNVVVHGLNLEHGRTYQMFVKAKNGSGVWSDERIAAGILQRIIIDTTPPTKPGRIFDLPPGVGGYVFDPPGGWGNYGDPMEIISPVPLPVQFQGKTSYDQPFLRLGGAEVAVNWLESEDPESGILRYEYKITNKENPSITSEWYDAGKNLSAQFHDNIMNYLDSFYVDIRSLNYANNISDNLQYIVRPVDESIPTKPGIAMATSRNGRGVYLVINNFSVDRQSGVDHYIVTMGVAPGGDDLISSADAITFDLSDVNRSNCVYLGSNLPQAESSYFTIRAVNGQGMKSSKCITGPFEQDLTPPIDPRVTPSLRTYFGVQLLDLRYSNVEDPESGISQIQYAMYVVGKKPSRLQWNNAGVVGNTSLRIDDSFPLKLNSRGGAEIVIGVRTINGFGLKSKEVWTLFNIPSN